MSQDDGSTEVVTEVVTQVVVEALGVPIGIPVTGEVASRLRHQWSRALTDRDAATVVDLSQLVTDDDTLHDYAVTSRVTLAALDATAGRRVNLHAGVVADEEGRAIALVGASGSGKTTAVQTLARRLGYLSDETTSVDEDLLVHAHPKPLSVIADPDAPLVKLSVSPDDLDLLRPPATAHLHRLVLLHRGDDDAGFVPLAPAHAIAAMVGQTSSLALVEDPIRRLADVIDACGGVWELHYREIEHWVEGLVDLLDLEGQPPLPRLHHPGTPDTGGPALSPDVWSRAPWRDAVEYDDELVLMVDARVHVLAGLGVLLWLALDEPRTSDELLEEVRELWGEHPDAVALVTGALRLMADEGMLLPPGSVGS